jgi:hypothetical protein
MKLKTHFVNLALLAVTAAFCLLLGEGIARLTLWPADYLSVEMVHDDVMGAVPSLHTKAGGLDAWGFRNREVPDTADIVVIGDSQTYGSSARMDDSWPYVLGRLTGRRVYNMSLGGYGPNQYLHLLKTKALSLKPRMISGPGLGRRLRERVSDYLELTIRGSPESTPREGRSLHLGGPEALTWHKLLRVWLTRHSMMYQLIVHGPVLGRLYGEIEFRTRCDCSIALVPEGSGKHP